MLAAELQTHHSMNMPSFIAAYIGTWYQFTIQIPADTKYIFFSSPVVRTIGLMKKAGTAHTFRTNIEGTVEVYGFRDSPPQASGNVGFQLFDEYGNLTFDAGFMKPVNALTVPTTGVEVQPWPNAARQYAVGLGVYPKQCRGASQAGVPWGILMSYCVRVGPNSGGGGLTAIASRPWGSAGGPAPGTTPLASPPTAMTVDVTGR